MNFYTPCVNSRRCCSVSACSLKMRAFLYLFPDFIAYTKMSSFLKAKDGDTTQVDSVPLRGGNDSRVNFGGGTDSDWALVRQSLCWLWDEALCATRRGSIHHHSFLAKWCIGPLRHSVTHSDSCPSHRWQWWCSLLRRPSFGSSCNLDERLRDEPKWWWWWWWWRNTIRAWSVMNLPGLSPNRFLVPLGM